MPYKQGKKWRAVVTIQGRRYQKLFPTKREAQLWEARERKRLLERTRTVYLLEAGTKYLDYSKARHTPKTYSEKRKAIRDLIKHTGDIPIESITADMILPMLLPKSTKNLFNRTRKELHVFFEFCRRNYSLTKNPVADIGRLPVERKPQPVPTEEEIVRLLVAAGRQDRNLLIAFITTGGRRSEIFRWTWTEDINFEKRIVRLGSRKTRSGEMRYRWVPMNDALYDALMDQWKTRLPNSDYVFQNKDPRHPRYGDRFTTRRRFMRSLCKRAGIEKDLGFHSLRRFFASILADKHKESLPVIQKLLGHASMLTTEKYVYNIFQDIKKAVDKIEIKIPHELPQNESRDEVR